MGGGASKSLQSSCARCLALFYTVSINEMNVNYVNRLELERLHFVSKERLINYIMEVLCSFCHPSQKTKKWFGPPPPLLTIGVVSTMLPVQSGYGNGLSLGAVCECK